MVGAPQSPRLSTCPDPSDVLTCHGPASLHYVDWGATFSPCMTYRYSLWRTWDRDRPRICWVLLNPSTADHENNDPTNMRCERRGRDMGFGGHVFVNCFALRSPYPSALRRTTDPIGPACNATIRDAILSTDICIAGWGNHGTLHDRNVDLLAIAEQCGRALQALAITGAGQPAHPLYLSYDLKPFNWNPEDLT